MIINEYEVEKSLASYFRKVFILDNARSSLIANKKCVLPNGCPALFFVFGQGMRFTTAKIETEHKEGVYLTGQLSRGVEVRLWPYTKVIILQCYPWTPSLFTTIDLSSIKNAYVPVSEVNKPFYHKFREFCPEDEKSLIGFLQKSFPNSLKKSSTTDLIQNSCSILYNQNPKFTIQDLSLHLGYSSRYIEKKFKNHLGLSPKEFFTIIKIRQAAQQLALGSKRSNMTQLAMEFGFYDQAHFIKAFRRLALISPREFDVCNYILSGHCHC
ncbi:helix-turn-helix transcriptional regulator [Xanthovirga aplysinae]|uniref:helix-turn-helix transcriptional regulator n=1 Tax=Xanthovirga aplysinae TaxID=2529853 RepID=UPI0012BC4D6C|nr:helix-turn-helix transcriptional regulator [Xanthovirga aplysinae]MTI33146.1 AraC family transcriptional regulator [Xanthovirga aplysinae]